MTLAWFQDLPPLRGPLAERASLAPFTWFRVGGPADLLFQPADEDDLAAFLAALPASVPVSVIGVGSNLLVRDGGIAGAVVRLGRGFTQINAEGHVVTAGAAALDVMVAKAAQRQGLQGLEFLRGIPGTVGGGLRMNAGAYGREFKDVLIEAAALTRSGERRVLRLPDMQFVYRASMAPGDLIFTSATFQGAPGDPAAILARMEEITAAREASQPVRSQTGGSTFKNPPGEKAWQLIDAAGCRGLRHGHAMVSEQHCNFLINLGGASAAEIEGLGERVRERVRAASGIELEWEIKRLGQG